MTAPPFRTVELSDPSIGADGLRFMTVKSAALGQRADLCLWSPSLASLESDALPPDAPLIVLLHGVYGSHWAWALKGAAHRTAARLIAAGALPPCMLAMPSDGLWGDGSGYVGHARQDFERWIVDEVPAAAMLAGWPGPAGRAFCVAGLSMGGFGALRLAGKYPHRIAAAASHSGVVHAASLDPLIEEDRSGWSEAPEDLDAAAALLASPGPLPPIHIDCGSDDPFIADNRALHTLLEREGIAHDYHERPGGHDWPYWSAAIEDSLRFFGAVLTGERE